MRFLRHPGGIGITDVWIEHSNDADRILDRAAHVLAADSGNRGSALPKHIAAVIEMLQALTLPEPGIQGPSCGAIRLDKAGRLG